MKGKFIAKFFVVCLAMSWLSFMPKSYAIEYEGDGTYLLHVGDRIKASNGYIIELECALGALGSRSDWLTVLMIFNPLGEAVNQIWSWGNCTRETDELYITIKRHIENEAIITVISKKQVAPKLLLTTDKPFYKLGENLTIILANIGGEIVQVGGYPAWQIYTYPEEKPVYPAVFALLQWSLAPGENDTFVWNQYDAFSYTFCKPGTYIIKDTQGWGLSALFRIYGECDFYGPFFSQSEVEYWVVQINGRPVRLISG